MGRFRRQVWGRDRRGERGEEKQVRQVGHITSPARLGHLAVNLGDFNIWIFKENMDVLLHPNSPNQTPRRLRVAGHLSTATLDTHAGMEVASVRLPVRRSTPVRASEGDSTLPDYQTDGRPTDPGWELELAL